MSQTAIEVTDAMLSEFRKAIGYNNVLSKEELTKGLTAALSALTQGGVKVKEHPGMQMCSLHHKILVSSGEPNMWHCPDCKKNACKPVDARALDEGAVSQVLQLLEVYAPDTFTLEMAATIASAARSQITLQSEPVGPVIGQDGAVYGNISEHAATLKSKGEVQ